MEFWSESLVNESEIIAFFFERKVARRIGVAEILNSLSNFWFKLILSCDSKIVLLCISL